MRRQSGNLYQKSSLATISDDEKIEFISSFPEIYTSNQPRFIGDQVSNSELAANSVLQSILDDVDRTRIENQVARKITPHILNMTEELLNLTIITQVANPTEQAADFIIDDEPEVSKIDNWGRNQINLHKMNEVSDAKLSLSEWNQHNHSQHQHEYYKEIQKAKEKAIRHIIALQKSEMPMPVELYEMNEEEQPVFVEMRKEMEARNKRKYDMEKQEQEQENLREKKKFENKKNEQKNKQFTYDYNGQIIYCKTADPNKFPPPLFNVDSRFADPNSALATKGRKQRLNLKPIATKTTGTLNSLVSPTQREYEPPNMFQNFVPKSGVAYKEGGSLKRGQPFSEADLPFTSTNNTMPLLNSTMRSFGKLTRRDYEKLKTEGSSFNHGNKTMTLQTEGPGSPFSAAGKEISKFAMTETFQIEKQPKKNFGSVSERGINIHSTRLLETLLKPSETNEEQFKFEASRSKLQQSVMVDTSLQKTSTDEFNLSIINSKAWGKNQVPNSIPQDPLLLPKIHDRSSKQLGVNVLGRLRSPRERTKLTSPNSTFYNTRSSDSSSFRWVKS